MIDAIAIAGLWTSVGLIGFSYLIYPLVVRAAAQLLGRQTLPVTFSEDAWPRVSLIVAAHNEEAVIDQRIKNALETDYPSNRFEMLVGSDSSTDRTNEIVADCEDSRVRLLAFEERGGKASVLNRVCPEATGEVLVFSDANTYFHPDAIRHLVAILLAPGVLGVCGRLMLVDDKNTANADGVYWRYETSIKKAEGQLGAVLGANGAIYAIRKEHFVPLPSNTIIDDLVGPLMAKLRHGGRLVYAPNAVATEEAAHDLRAEFRRRCRIGAGNFQSLKWLWPVLSPTRGWTCLAFFSHKLLRWVTPHLMILAFVSNLWLASRPFYAVLLIVQVLFYAAAIVGPRFASLGKSWAVIRLAEMFVAMNIALLVGFLRWLRGDLSGTWRRTARSEATSSIALGATNADG